ncbi:MAG TPA: hypothetical protein DDW65_05880 [Firmicutes bacterium]|jgi:hypothetical protein|nr:hypothetical protein [Bacillota bacterium]
MKRKLVLGLFFILLAFLSGYIVFQISSTGTKSTNTTAGTTETKVAKDTAQIYNGYLVCQMCACAPHGKAADGVNVLQHPELHTVSCLKMPACTASGFGIFVKTQAGHCQFLKFDQHGSQLALKDIVSKTAKTDHLSVEVTGRLQNQNKTLQVEQIIEK